MFIFPCVKPDLLLIKNEPKKKKKILFLKKNIKKAAWPPSTKERGWLPKGRCGQVVTFVL